ncbi:unnamed protein product [Closterium sp. NIES-64]|nr:unnamed protein product [Closterium sp. NIES-64]
MFNRGRKIVTKVVVSADAELQQRFEEKEREKRREKEKEKEREKPGPRPSEWDYLTTVVQQNRVAQRKLQAIAGAESSPAAASTAAAAPSAAPAGGEAEAEDQSNGGDVQSYTQHAQRPGYVQQHGSLLFLEERSYRILAVAENIFDFFDQPDRGNGEKKAGEEREEETEEGNGEGGREKAEGGGGKGGAAFSCLVAACRTFACLVAACESSDPQLSNPILLKTVRRALPFHPAHPPPPPAVHPPLPLPPRPTLPLPPRPTLCCFSSGRRSSPCSFSSGCRPSPCSFSSGRRPSPRSVIFGLPPVAPHLHSYPHPPSFPQLNRCSNAAEQQRSPPDGSSSNFKAWSYGVDKHLLSRDVQGLDLKDVLLNRGKGKQPTLPREPTESSSDADVMAYEEAVEKYRKWEKADAAIISVFIASTPLELVNTFHNYPISNAIWKYLQDRFMNKTAVGVAILIPSMFQELGIVFPEQAPAAALLVGLSSAYEVTRKMLLTLSAEDLTFAKVSTALLSAEKDSTAQAKAYAIRAPMPPASVAAALASAPFQRNRFPPCTYVIKYGNRKGQVCGGTNHPLATCFKKKDDEWYAIHGYIDSSQAPQYIEFTLDSGATHTVLKETLSFKPYPAPIPLLGADSSFTTLAKGTSTVPCPAFPSGTVTGMCVPSLRHNLVAQTEIQKAGLRTIFSENEDHCDIIDPLTNKVLARFTLNSSGLYTLRVPLPQVSTTQAQAPITPCTCRSLSNPTILYHHRLGHPSFRTLADMASKKLLLGLPATLPPPPDSPAPTCLDCTKSKLRQQPHTASPTIAAAPLDLVHMDVWGPAPVLARGGYRYFLVIVDDHVTIRLCSPPPH